MNSKQILRQQTMMKVIELLRNEMNVVGGRLFASEMERLSTEAQAASGNQDAARQLKVSDFINELLDKPEATNDDEQYLFDLIEAINCLKRKG